jgi:hypothetical protein
MLGTCGIRELEDLSMGNPNQPSDVQAVVAWFGPTDFLKMDEQLTEGGMPPRAGMEHTQRQSRWRCSATCSFLAPIIVWDALETKQDVSTSAQLPRRTVVFCSFVGLAACMNLKWLWLGIDFEVEARDARPLDENNPASKAMKGSIRQLGLRLEKAQ